MSLNEDNELLIREDLANIIGTVNRAGYVIPAARYCSGIEEFWTSTDEDKDTRDEIELSLIAATWIYPITVTDDFSVGICKEKPLISLVYEIYMFRQYGLMRKDESDTPDVFGSKVLVQHNDFIAGWLGIKEEFQRDANLASLSGTVFVERKTTPVVQIEPIVNQAVCEFVPGAVGFAVRLQETVKLRLA